MAFLDDNYLLDSALAEAIYDHVKDLPVVDAHNHGDVKEIVDNEGWNDIWEVEGATDHYVWELMRRRGVPEEKVTGAAANREKWKALAKIFPEFAGNPTYEWIHLDLKRRFGIDDNISELTADSIWDDTLSLLKQKTMKPQSLLKEMNVKIMCTTDDPDSTLEYHKRAAEEIEGIKILPTWRPDKAMNIEKENWPQFVENLGEVVNEDVSDLDGFLDALQKSHDHFEKMGCVASDHGLAEPYSYAVNEDHAAEIYQKARARQGLTEEDIKDFKAFMLFQFGRMNEASGWTTQMHIGAVRDYRDKLYADIGSDSGGDIGTHNVEIVRNIRYFLNEFDESLEIVFYHLDPSLLPTLASIARAFPNVNLGAPWWFNDSPQGMAEQLNYISTVDLLSNHAGMVTDSRKLISYGSRTEMFRRVASNVLATMVKRGQMPEKLAYELAASLSYYRPQKLFFEDIKLEL